MKYKTIPLLAIILGLVVVGFKTIPSNVPNAETEHISFNQRMKCHNLGEKHMKKIDNLQYSIVVGKPAFGFSASRNTCIYLSGTGVYNEQEISFTHRYILNLLTNSILAEIFISEDAEKSSDAEAMKRFRDLELKLLTEWRTSK